MWTKFAACAERALRPDAAGALFEKLQRLDRLESVRELRGAAAVVLDPPWTGAGPQTALLAVSGVPMVIYVSCNPAALARDARPLLAAGYRVERVTPVDQFLWSARVEAVAVFRSR